MDRAEGILDFLDKFSLMVGLVERYLGAQFPGERGEAFIDVFKRNGPVNLRFPFAEKIQVRSVHDENVHSILIPRPDKIKNCSRQFQHSASTARKRLAPPAGIFKIP